MVPDERSALETEIARLQGENATLKKELLAGGLPVPGVSAPSGAKPGEPELKLPSDAEVDKVISFLEKVWCRLIEMARTVQKDVEKKNCGSLGARCCPPSSCCLRNAPLAVADRHAPTGCQSSGTISHPTP